MLVQSKTAKHRVDSIDGLYKELHGQLPRFNTKYAAPFLDALFVTPIFTRASIAQQAQIPHKQTVATLIDRFVAAGQVRDLTPQRLRDKTYTLAAPGHHRHRLAFVCFTGTVRWGEEDE